MSRLLDALAANSRISDYKINVHYKDSYELFFVKGKLETLRRTETCDREVTVYVAHDDYLGDAQFYVYPYTTDEQLTALIDEAVEKALLIHNKAYTLPPEEVDITEEAEPFRPEELAAMIANTVFSANEVENGSLNSLEIFVNRHHEIVRNSRGLHKSQVRYNAMVEAIPTYNGAKESVELYEQYNFSDFQQDALAHEIRFMMDAVKARYEAIKPTFPIDCKVILNKVELAQLFDSLVDNMRYVTVYSHSGVFKKGDALQKDPTGDRITITMAGQAPGVSFSSRFDRDGTALGSCTLVDQGIVTGYYGANRYGQYLGEVPTGLMNCMCVTPGTADDADIHSGPYLEVISMSGLQVDCFSDYIGGEVRLAYYHDGEKKIPVTGISISGSLQKSLASIRFSKNTVIHDAYLGPEKAVLDQMKVY